MGTLLGDGAPHHEHECDERLASCDESPYQPGPLQLSWTQRFHRGGLRVSFFNAIDPESERLELGEREIPGGQAAAFIDCC